MENPVISDRSDNFRTVKPHPAADMAQFYRNNEGNPVSLQGDGRIDRGEDHFPMSFHDRRLSLATLVLLLSATRSSRAVW
jgi:hypothetical protein